MPAAPLTILDCLDRPSVFPGFTDPSWTPWRTILAAVFGLPVPDPELFTHLTNRTTPPTDPVREAWIVAGRRAGKSRIAALIGVYLACFRDYSARLAPGEWAVIAVIAADRAQARTVMSYVVGLLDASPLLARLVTSTSAECVELGTRVRIEVHTCSYRSVRGYSLAGAICDEIAFWRSDESSRNPDSEVIAALRPGLANLRGPLVAISSPYSRKGALWQAHRRHFGAKGDPGVLVVQAPSRLLNPSLPEHVVADALADDPQAAAAEWNAQFRSDVETFVSREVLDACTDLGITERPPEPSLRYVAFVDPSGGSQDSMALAVAHRAEDGSAVLDLVREVRAPLSPEAVTADFCALLKAYNVHEVRGDRYGGSWPQERFAVHGVTYRSAELVKSDLYQAALPLFTSGRAALLDLPRLVNQLAALERRTGRGGRGVVDHGPGQHDDLGNAVAGALVLVSGRPEPPFLQYIREQMRDAEANARRAEVETDRRTHGIPLT